MNRNEQHSDGVMVYEDELTIRFQVLDRLPGDVTLATINETNESLLRAIMTLTDHREIDEHDEHAVELRRIDLKINLLMDAISELLAREQQLPAATHARLSSQQLEWYGEPRPTPGTFMRVEIHLQRGVPRALTLFGSVASSDEAASSLVFQGVNHGVRDWLERLIFRHHRRSVAQELANRPE